MPPIVKAWSRRTTREVPFSSLNTPHMSAQRLCTRTSLCRYPSSTRARWFSSSFRWRPSCPSSGMSSRPLPYQAPPSHRELSQQFASPVQPSCPSLGMSSRLHPLTRSSHSTVCLSCAGGLHQGRTAHRSGHRHWVLILALPLTDWVIMGKFSDLSVPQFPHL